MRHGGLGLGAYKEGSSCSSLANTHPTFGNRVTLSHSFPSRELCYEPENSEGDLESERQTRELP